MPGDIKIYPNPACDDFVVSSPSFRYDKLQIYDLSGKCLKVLKTPYEPEKRIHAGLPAGFHTLSLSGPEGERSTKFKAIDHR